MKKILALFLLFFLFAPALVFALDVPDKPSGYVNDYAHLLLDSTRQVLEGRLTEFEKTTSNQVVVAIFDSLEGGSLEDFSIRLAEKWKIGQKGKDNGAILVIFKSDRKMRIEVGYGLEGALPDVVANQIIQNQIAPNFRQGNYDAGVTSAVNAIMEATRGEYIGQSAVDLDKDPSKILGMLFVAALTSYLFWPFFCYVLVFIICFLAFGVNPGFFVALVLDAMLAMIRPAIYPVGNTYSARGRSGGYWGLYGGGSSSGRSSGGFSSGGFGGGRGGSFGGGGSSGSW